MEEYIELINRLRQEAEFEAYLQPNSANETPKLLSKAADVIEKLSGERKKGKWIQQTLEVKPFGEDTVLCDQCAFMTDRDSRYNFCPHCGADMRGET